MSQQIPPARSMRLRVGAAVVALIALGTTLSGCVGYIGSTRCDMNVQNPHQSNGSPRYMDSKMTFICDAVVKNVEVRIRMQKRTATGVWVTVPNSLNVLKKPILQRGQKLTLQTSGNILCSAGTYRTQGWGAGTNLQGEHATSGANWYNGDPVHVTCPRT